MHLVFTRHLNAGMVFLRAALEKQTIKFALFYCFIGTTIT